MTAKTTGIIFPVIDQYKIFLVFLCQFNTCQGYFVTIEIHHSIKCRVHRKSWMAPQYSHPVYETVPACVLLHTARKAENETSSVSI